MRGVVAPSELLPWPFATRSSSCGPPRWRLSVAAADRVSSRRILLGEAGWSCWSPLGLVAQPRLLAVIAVGLSSPRGRIAVRSEAL